MHSAGLFGCLLELQCSGVGLQIFDSLLRQKSQTTATCKTTHKHQNLNNTNEKRNTTTMNNIF
jgi:hypothetical protein